VPEVDDVLDRVVAEVPPGASGCAMCDCRTYVVLTQRAPDPDASRRPPLLRSRRVVRRWRGSGHGGLTSLRFTRWYFARFKPRWFERSAESSPKLDRAGPEFAVHLGIEGEPVLAILFGHSA
jgi:hypothetical protein